MEHMKFVDSDMLDEMEVAHDKYVKNPHESALLGNSEKLEGNVARSRKVARCHAGLKRNSMRY